jgi:hypothetical protein
LRIAVIDGQGGGLGRSLIERLRKDMPKDIKILALGTNSTATVLMLKAGADEGATGENAIICNAPKVEYILGPIGIIIANSLMGELTPSMARAVCESPAKKILIPMGKCNVEVAGVKQEQLASCMEDAVNRLKEYY